MSVVGYGRAEKAQVQMMVRSILSLEHELAGRCVRCARRRHLSCYPGLARSSSEGRPMKVRRGSRCSSLLVLLPRSLSPAIPTQKFSTPRVFPGQCSRLRIGGVATRPVQAVYKEAPDDENPVDFKMSAEDTNEIFALVDKLDRFKRPLESNLKVANMGMKTFRFEDGVREERSEVQFLPRRGCQAFCRIGSNASPKPSGCSSIWNAPPSSTGSALTRRSCRSRSAYDRKRLVGVDRFLPLLDRVAKNDSYLHMARERAASLADAFRNPKPKTTE